MTEGQGELALAVASLLLDGFAEIEDEAAAYARMAELGLAATPPYRLVVLATRLTSRAARLTLAAKTADKALRRYYSCCSIASGGRLLTLLLSEDGFFRLDAALNELCQALRRQYDTDCLIGVSREFPAFIAAYTACGEAVEAQRALSAPGVKSAAMLCGGAEGRADGHKRDGVSLLCERALKIIDSEYMNEELTLSSVSERLHVSSSYLSANMKKYAGDSFVNLLTKRRMEAALKLLDAGGMKIGELARRCGYGDQHYFSFCFKKYYGASPAKLRRGKADGKKEQSY